MADNQLGCVPPVFRAIVQKADGMTAIIEGHEIVVYQNTNCQAVIDAYDEDRVRTEEVSGGVVHITIIRGGPLPDPGSEG